MEFKESSSNHKPIYWLLSSSAQKNTSRMHSPSSARSFSLQEKQIADCFYTSAGQHFLSCMKKLSPVTAKTPDSAPERSPDQVEATAACCHVCRRNNIQATVLLVSNGGIMLRQTARQGGNREASNAPTRVTSLLSHQKNERGWRVGPSLAATADTEKDHHDFVYQGKQKPKSMAEIRRHNSCEQGTVQSPKHLTSRMSASAQKKYCLKCPQFPAFNSVLKKTAGKRQ